MADPARAWHDEHMYFNRMLAMLSKEVDALATGESPNYGLMLDILSYLGEYADQVHHPREDEVFRRLVLLRPDRELRVARLRQEHRVIAAAGETLRTLLEEAVSDAMVSREEIEIAAATFLVYYGNHIKTEEEDIIPLAAKLLSEADWAAAKAIAPSAHDPMFGAIPTQRFSELRRRIAAEAG